ncbi:MRPS18 (YNL306W) [Zygosaccharomyces parabailii]|nr:MRPS18 (YNL306W) [Zygosaccharomyces parabailii]
MREARICFKKKIDILTLSRQDAVFNVAVIEGKVVMKSANVLSCFRTLGIRYQSTSAGAGTPTLSFSSIARLNEQQEISNVVGPSKGKPATKPNTRPVKYILNCLFTKNNTHFTYSAVMEDVNFLKNNENLSYNDKFLYYLNLPQRVKFSLSTGCLGFRKAARGEYEATFQTSAKVFQMIQDKKLMNKDIEIVMKDFGKGRAAFIAALNGKEGTQVRKNVIRISDKTPLKFGGVRAPRVRRL